MPKKRTFKHRKHESQRRRQVKQQSSDSDGEQRKWQISLPQHWKDQTCETEQCIRLCRLQNLPLESQHPVAVHACLVVQADGSWEAFTRYCRLTPSSCPLLSQFPDVLTPAELPSLVDVLDKSTVCCGNPDKEYTELACSRKGVFKDVSGKNIKAKLDSTPFVCDDSFYLCTVRSSDCEVLVSRSAASCSRCKEYRSTLRSLVSKAKAKTKTSSEEMQQPLSTTNWRYLNTPEKKERAKRRTEEIKRLKAVNERLKDKIAHLCQKEGVILDHALYHDIVAVMEENQESIHSNHKEGSFQRLFWDQQMAAAKLSDPRQMRWHPHMIRWCLHLRLVSGGGYRLLRESGTLQLPSERTLRDYTHVVPPAIGFQEGVAEQLADQAKLDSLHEWEKFVVLTFDEMKIKGLVYNKYTDSLVGFISLADVSRHLVEFERQCQAEHASGSTHMLVLLIRGVFIDLKFPFAQFTTAGIAAHELYPIITEAILRLEILGFKVISLTSDGASPNRALYHMMQDPTTSGDLAYRSPNPFTSESRSIYFMSDVPHLLKTTCNCWSHSHAHSRSRCLWINERDISWQHLVRAYEANQGRQTDTPGLCLLHKVKAAHIHLTYFSRMRVDLAAQVLSSSVANAMENMGDTSMSETIRFVRFFDHFFDCLNVNSLSGGRKSLKSDLYPYRTPTDTRLKWLEEHFLGYLAEWQRSIASRPNKSVAEQTKMCLSRETLLGLRISVKSFVEMGRFLLSVPGVKFLLSEHFTQDPLESFFGKQRQRGGGNENPTAHQFTYVTSSLRILKSVAPAARGNVRGSKHHMEEIDDTPLPKRKQPRKN